MYATIVSRGSFSTLRLPKAVWNRAGLSENDRVEVSCENNAITIRKAPIHHRTLEERLTAFYGKPLEEISPCVQEEYDWGQPEGVEVW